MSVKNLILYLIFFISGFCGLCYEILWCREFNLILGHTTYATAMVLASFMSGLALGSWSFGRIADRAGSVASLYAYLEFAIGIYGICFYRLIEIYKEFYIYAHPYMTSPAAETAFKLSSSFALMIIPSTLMGATFPVMARIILENLETRGRSLGLIYFFNSAGGALGCFVCGFYMLYNFGAEFTLNVVTGLNILCGAAMLAARGRFVEGAAPRPASGAAAAEGESVSGLYGARTGVAHSDGANRIFFFFLLSGFVSMLLEVCWTRFLILIIGSSTYSFSLMLSVFIFFLAAGSLLAAYFADRAANPMLGFGVCELLIGAYIFLTLPFYEKLPLAFVGINNSIGGSYYIYMLLNLVVCLAVMAVPALLFGATFPFAVRAVKMSSADGASAVGKLYSYNTVGCILGSLLTGIVILPAFGFKNSIESAIVITLLIFLAVSFEKPNGTDAAATKSMRWARGACVIMVVSVFFLPAWDHKILNIGSFYRTRGLNENAVRTLARHSKVLYYKESSAATVFVMEDDRNGLKYLKINGKTDGSTMRHDMLTQHFTAILPMSRVKSAKNVLIIGLGTGASLAAACKFVEAEKITCVEIVPEVIEAAKYFTESYEVYKNDPRVKIVVNDARSFLLTTREKFDAIISEPSNPWISGIGSLFTTDFFSMAHARLADGGVMLAWIQAYESSPEVFKLALRTYLDSFKEASLWFNANYDVYAMGVKKAKEDDTQTIKEEPAADEPALCFEKIKKLPQVAALVESHGITDPFTFSALRLMTPKQLKVYAGDGALNSDNFQIIEYEAPMLLFNEQRVKLDYRAYADALDESLKAHAAAAASGEISVEKMISNAAHFLGENFLEPRITLSLTDLLVRRGAAGEDIWRLRAGLFARTREYGAALEAITQALVGAPDNIGYLKFRAELALTLAENRLADAAWPLLATAEADLTKAAAAAPLDFEALRGLLEVHRLKRDKKALMEIAAKTFEDAAKAKEKAATAETLIISAANAGAVALALAAAEKLIELNAYREAEAIYSRALERAETPLEKELICAKLEACRFLFH